MTLLESFKRAAKEGITTRQRLRFALGFKAGYEAAEADYEPIIRRLEVRVKALEDSVSRPSESAIVAPARKKPVTKKSPRRKG